MARRYNQISLRDLFSNTPSDYLMTRRTSNQTTQSSKQSSQIYTNQSQQMQYGDRQQQPQLMQQQPQLGYSQLSTQRCDSVDLVTGGRFGEGGDSCDGLSMNSQSILDSQWSQRTESQSLLRPQPLKVEQKVFQRSQSFGLTSTQQYPGPKSTASTQSFVGSSSASGRKPGEMGPGRAYQGLQQSQLEMYRLKAKDLDQKDMLGGLNQAVFECGQEVRAAADEVRGLILSMKDSIQLGISSTEARLTDLTTHIDKMVEEKISGALTNITTLCAETLQRVNALSNTSSADIDNCKLLINQRNQYESEWSRKLDELLDKEARGCSRVELESLMKQSYSTVTEELSRVIVRNMAAHSDLSAMTDEIKQLVEVSLEQMIQQQRVKQTELNDLLSSRLMESLSGSVLEKMPHVLEEGVLNHMREEFDLLQSHFSNKLLPQILSEQSDHSRQLLEELLGAAQLQMKQWLESNQQLVVAELKAVQQSSLDQLVEAASDRNNATMKRSMSEVCDRWEQQLKEATAKLSNDSQAVEQLHRKLNESQVQQLRELLEVKQLCAVNHQLAADKIPGSQLLDKNHGEKLEQLFNTVSNTRRSMNCDVLNCYDAADYRVSSVYTSSENRMKVSNGNASSGSYDKRSYIPEVSSLLDANQNNSVLYQSGASMKSQIDSQSSSSVNRCAGLGKVCRVTDEKLKALDKSVNGQMVEEDELNMDEGRIAGCEDGTVEKFGDFERGKKLKSYGDMIDQVEPSLYKTAAVNRSSLSINDVSDKTAHSQSNVAHLNANNSTHQYVSTSSSTGVAPSQLFTMKFNSSEQFNIVSSFASVQAAGQLTSSCVYPLRANNTAGQLVGSCVNPLRANVTAGQLGGRCVNPLRANITAGQRVGSCVNAIRDATAGLGGSYLCPRYNVAVPSPIATVRPQVHAVPSIGNRSDGKYRNDVLGKVTGRAEDIILVNCDKQEIERQDSKGRLDSSVNSCQQIENILRKYAINEEKADKFNLNSRNKESSMPLSIEDEVEMDIEQCMGENSLNRLQIDCAAAASQDMMLPQPSGLQSCEVSQDIACNDECYTQESMLSGRVTSTVCLPSAVNCSENCALECGGRNEWVVCEQLASQVEGQLTGQVREQVTGQLLGELPGQLAGSVEMQLSEQLTGYLSGQSQYRGDRVSCYEESQVVDGFDEVRFPLNHNTVKLYEEEEGRMAVRDLSVVDGNNSSEGHDTEKLSSVNDSEKDLRKSSNLNQGMEDCGSEENIVSKSECVSEKRSAIDNVRQDSFTAQSSSCVYDFDCNTVELFDVVNTMLSDDRMSSQRVGAKRVRPPSRKRVSSTPTAHRYGLRSKGSGESGKGSTGSHQLCSETIKDDAENRKESCENRELLERSEATDELNDLEKIKININKDRALNNSVDRERNSENGSDIIEHTVSQAGCMGTEITSVNMSEDGPDTDAQPQLSSTDHNNVANIEGHSSTVMNKINKSGTITNPMLDVKQNTKQQCLNSDYTYNVTQAEAKLMQQLPSDKKNGDKSQAVLLARKLEKPKNQTDTGSSTGNAVMNDESCYDLQDYEDGILKSFSKISSNLKPSTELNSKSVCGKKRQKTCKQNITKGQVKKRSYCRKSQKSCYEVESSKLNESVEESDGMCEVHELFGSPGAKRQDLKQAPARKNKNKKICNTLTADVDLNASMKQYHVNEKTTDYNTNNGSGSCAIGGTARTKSIENIYAVPARLYSSLMSNTNTINTISNSAISSNTSSNKSICITKDIGSNPTTYTPISKINHSTSILHKAEKNSLEEENSQVLKSGSLRSYAAGFRQEIKKKKSPHERGQRDSLEERWLSVVRPEGFSTSVASSMGAGICTASSFRSFGRNDSAEESCMIFTNTSNRFFSKRSTNSSTQAMHTKVPSVRQGNMVKHYDTMKQGNAAKQGNMVKQGNISHSNNDDDDNGMTTDDDDDDVSSTCSSISISKLIGRF